MEELARRRLAELLDQVDERHDGMKGEDQLPLHLLHVEQLDSRLAGDFIGILLLDDAQLGLGPR